MIRGADRELERATERRRVVYFALTEEPTPAWTMQQLREAFPWDDAPLSPTRVSRSRDPANHGGLRGS